MSGIVIQANTDKIANKLIRLASGLRDRSQPARELAVQLYGDSIRNFQSQGAYFKQSWQALAQRTQEEKAKSGYTQMLVRTGALRNAFFWNISANYVAIGNNVPYASYHQQGTSRMPARTLLPPPEYAVQRGIEVFSAYVKRLASEVG